MDGLASGITVAVAFGLLVLTLVAGSQAAAQQLLVPYVDRADELAVLAGAVLGACLGFLWWNCSPAQVFMGDTGSLCLGGLLGYMAVIIRQEFVVLVMCGVFLAEIASVVMQVGYFRFSAGRRIFRCAPIHHHFHLAGWTEQQVVARFWIIAILLVVIGLASIKIR
jgi:phospho-N-acetylmuramoyl-pentapeptide-transferase